MNKKIRGYSNPDSRIAETVWEKNTARWLGIDIIKPGAKNRRVSGAPKGCAADGGAGIHAMNISERLCSKRLRMWRVVGALFVSLASADGQRYEFTPLVGGMFGGTWKLEQQGVPNFEARLQDRLSFGVAGGVRFDGDDCEGCNLIEFRWLRQNTHLKLEQDPLVPTTTTVSYFHPAVRLDHFLGDFTYEWTVEEAPIIKPFVNVSMGAVRASTPAASATRFAFGIGTGIKVFPKRKWGIRFHVEYLPIIMHAELQRVVCVGGCIVALSGGVMNQFHVSIGPAFRF